jgi:hypothetical protein
LRSADPDAGGAKKNSNLPKLTISPRVSILPLCSSGSETAQGRDLPPFSQPIRRTNFSIDESRTDMLGFKLEMHLAPGVVAPAFAAVIVLIGLFIIK